MSFLNLSSTDYFQVGVTNRNCMRVLPVAEKFSTQKCSPRLLNFLMGNFSNSRDWGWLRGCELPWVRQIRARCQVQDPGLLEGDYQDRAQRGWLPDAGQDFCCRRVLRPLLLKQREGVLQVRYQFDRADPRLGNRGHLSMDSRGSLFPIKSISNRSVGAFAQRIRKPKGLDYREKLLSLSWQNQWPLHSLPHRPRAFPPSIGLPRQLLEGPFLWQGNCQVWH